MEIQVQLTNAPIAATMAPPRPAGRRGAWMEFRGVVRGEENGKPIGALEYEAYAQMAIREIRRLLRATAQKHPCLAAKVIHRVGLVPVGETAIYVGVAAKHRGTAMALLAEFMDRLKQDVPVWKRRALSARAMQKNGALPSKKMAAAGIPTLDAAVAEIRSRCKALPPVRISLGDAPGRVLRETVCAPEDFPDHDRSTRDGFAILRNDRSVHFKIVDTLHAADWKPRRLKTGQAVRIATGASLPGEHLRVVMQENVERHGDRITLRRRERALNLRHRGEDVKAGAVLIPAGAPLDAGKLALLAAAGRTQPLVSPRLRVVHFTTGDEIVPPDQMPKPGQIRDSNSILMRGLLQNYCCDLKQKHLPEDFALARAVIGKRKAEMENTGVLLISGGASVGEKDFTRALLEWLGFKIVFSQVNVRPGRPLIFGLKGKTVAFGLPGNPLAHFVCFHLFVAEALAKLTGMEGPKFRRGKLAGRLADAPCPRETLWPARLEFLNGEWRLRPRKWSSSGDVTGLAEAAALIRVPANQGSLDADAMVDFLPTTARMDGQ